MKEKKEMEKLVEQNESKNPGFNIFPKVKFFLSSNSKYLVQIYENITTEHLCLVISSSLLSMI